MKTVVVDIDGTLADITHRKHFIMGAKKDWKSFENPVLKRKDAPIMEIINLVKILKQHYNIVLCTGRHESEREATEIWLERYDIKYNVLLMREDDDFRNDFICKPEMLRNSGVDKTEVEFILEDRNSVVQRWRDLGYICLHVADGNF